VLLVTSPRVAPGVLTWFAWEALREAQAVWGRAGEPQVDALAEAGILASEPPCGMDDFGRLARHLVDAAKGHLVVWVGSSDGDPGLTDAIAEEVSRGPGAPEIELLLGSYDVPGAALLDVVAVMDRLRSPGGCPWDAEQTHESLAPYLLEEAHEAVEAMETGDRSHLVEELGDVLLQVVFHARVGEEDPDEPFGIDDVAAGLVAKLVRRHPHVFGAGTASTPAEVEQHWNDIKAAEKPHRVGLLDGVPASMSTLSRAEKALARAQRTGGHGGVTVALAGDDDGARVLALVEELRAKGVSADGALRATLRTLAEQPTEGGAQPARPAARD
jgi:XTP/dITP diphosphohydrolase